MMCLLPRFLRPPSIMRPAWMSRGFSWAYIWFLSTVSSPLSSLISSKLTENFISVAPAINYLDYPRHDLVNVIGNLKIKDFHKRQDDPEWRLAQVIDFDSFVQDPEHSPPFVLFYLGNIRYLSTDMCGWREYNAYLGKTGASRQQPGKLFVAKAHHRWKYEALKFAFAERDCFQCMYTTMRVTKWLLQFQGAIKDWPRPLGSKPVDEAALELKVPFILDSLTRLLETRLMLFESYFLGGAWIYHGQRWKSAS